ncbi:beta strand repeat-containing protein [Dialister hominis]|uniref:beta strand repeat-containing protein n=1 Tax=Dialister hominis TaxID=2582419 RepID=UPI003AB27167
MKKNYKLLATLVLSGLAGAAFGVLPAEAAVTVGPVDGTEKPLTNTEFTSLYGNTYTGSTSGNTVSISGEGTVTLNTLAGAYTLESGDASNNKLSVTDGASVSFSNATDNWIAGGRSMKGAASGNQVTLSGVSLNLPDATPSSLKIAGGETESGNADGNTVTLDTITSSGIVYGGRVGNGNNVVATVNMSVLPVSAEESTETDTSTEADPISTSASSNSVTITGSQVEGVYGGYMQYYGDTSAEADAVAGVNHNTVTLTNSTAQSSYIYGIYGGYMQYYRDTSAEADAVAGVNHNTVTLTNSTAQSSYIYGGYMQYYGDTSAEADAVAGVNHNTVTLTNTSAFGTSVYGGYVLSSGSAPALNAGSNTVEISNTAEKEYGVSTVTGGYTGYGDANDNTVKITGTKVTDDDEIYLTSVSSDITGGETESGNADGNTVTLDTIASSGIVYGGRAGNGNNVAEAVLMSVLAVSTEESTGTDTSTEADPISTSASSNSVTITGSQVKGVYGGVGQIGSAKGNIVTITDSSVEMEAVGGETGYMVGWITQPGQLKDAENNQVIVNGSSTIGTVVGGEAAAANTFDEKNGEVQTSGKSSGNTVTINDGTVKNSVLGGHSAMSDAIGNTVNIAGGIIGTESSGTGEADDNAIAGGFAEEGQANNNTVNITGGTLGAMMSLYGGYSEKGSSGNTLNLHTKGNTVKNLGYFQNLNFYVPEGTAAGETMVTVTGNADVSKAVIQAGIEKTTKLAPGQAINLIYDAGGIKTDGTSYSMMSGKDIVSDAGFVDRKAAVKKQDDNTIVVYVPKDEKGTIHPDTKIIPEDRENGINTIKNAGDLVSNAAEGAWKEDHDVDAKFVPYAIVGGYDLHYNTGSYIDSNGMAANVGLIRRIRRDGAIDTVMPFLEYGRSNYASFLDDGARGDGRQHYTGGGVLLRRDLDDGKYYEGAIRAGRLKGDFHGIIDSTALRYDSSAPYVAAQAGAGKIYAKDRDTYDLYGKFFWTHLGSDTATIRNSRGEAKYEFDDINSYRTRLGMRWTRNFDKVRSLYAGIGWDYEFDSKARAFYDAYRTDTPTVKGSSEFLELGWKSKVTSDHPWGVDLKATGWTGKQEGGTLFATVSRSF